METQANEGEGEGDAKARRRQVLAERERMRRAAHAAAGLCVTCSKPAVEGRPLCADCIARRAQRSNTRREEARAVWDALYEKAMVAPLLVPCPFCGENELYRDLVRYGGPRLFCDVCKREFRKSSLPPALLPCPYCGGRCVNSGRRQDGNRVYLCKACHKHNTNFWPADSHSPGGPFPHKMTFNLGPLSCTNLMRYCQEHKMSMAQAVREIFRGALKEPLHKMSSSRRTYNTDGSYEISVRSATAANDPRYDPNQRFPNISSEVTKRRMAQGNRLHRTVGISLCVSLRLDDLAKEGLIKATVMFQMDHQRAARLLIERAV